MSEPNANVLAVIEAAIKRTSPTTHFNERAGMWAAHAAIAELIERLEASDWRLSNLLALIPEGRPERAQIEQDMADNRAALARVGACEVSIHIYDREIQAFLNHQPFADTHNDGIRMWQLLDAEYLTVDTEAIARAVLQAVYTARNGGGE